MRDLNHQLDRGWKSTFSEGGVKTPFYLRWPATIPEPVRYDHPVIHADPFTTVARAAGARVPDDRTMDGVDLLPYVDGSKAGRPHEALFWHQGHYSVAIADGWKLQTTETPKKTWLSHLDQDPAEQVNLADRHPERTEALQAALRPLLITCCLAYELLHDNKYYDAVRIVVLSASSKTASTLAACIKFFGNVPIVGGAARLHMNV